MPNDGNVLFLVQFRRSSGDTAQLTNGTPIPLRPPGLSHVINRASVEKILEVHRVMLLSPNHIDQTDVAPRGITLHYRTCLNRDEYRRNVLLDCDNGSQEC